MFLELYRLYAFYIMPIQHERKQERDEKKTSSGTLLINYN